MVKPPSKHPALYELNTRGRLSEISQDIGRRATLDDFSSAELDRLAARGFEWVWLLGVWQTGEVGRRISRSLPELWPGYEQALPGLEEDDICGSPFAIAAYTVSSDFGGDQALALFRTQLRDRGMRLMLDFVPNHTAIDHPWVREHPEFYVRGSERDVQREPGNYLLLPDAGVFAHGRDPYFPGWTDTLQLNYGNPLLQEAMRQELLKIAERCDGVRCDMAMLLAPEVFEKTWGISAQPFWPETIRRVRNSHPGFVFLAEVYWDMEWDLQQQGFDYTYDKRLYDRLRSRDAAAVRAHLTAGIDFQRKSVRFLENHDEPRAAETFPPEVHQAAALISYFVPGMRFFHTGQLEGRRRRASVHLCRLAAEPVDAACSEFYSRLLNCLSMPVLRNGDWGLLETSPEPFLAFAWRNEQSRLLVIVNYSPWQGRCSVKLPFAPLAGSVQLRDCMSAAVCQRDGGGSEWYFDLPGWAYHAFELS